jgi:ABC-type Na+ efflux pump permease subunit
VLVLLYSRENLSGEYINPTSYNVNTGFLAIIDGERAQSYRITRNTQIKLNDQPAGVNMISGRYKVAQKSQGPGMTLTSLSLIDVPRRLSAPDARSFLLGAVIVEFAVILLIVTNAAASTVTREKEDGTLDLLLSTPITSRYYIWGKLRGLVSFAVPLIVVPVVSCLVFILYDLVGGSGRQQWVVLPEALVLMPALLVILVAFASIVGMNLSLRQKTTVRAVMISLAVVIGLFALLGWCGFEIASSSSEVGLVFGAFSPLTVIMLLINPELYGGSIFTGGDPSRIIQARIVIFIFSLAACGAYAAIIWAMYKSMVKNFDMTIRRQQR